MLVFVVPNLQSGGTEWQTYFLIRALVSRYQVCLWVYSDDRKSQRLYERYLLLNNLTICFGGTIKAIVRLAKLKPKLIISYAINYYIPEIILSVITGAVLITERRNLYHWIKHEKRKILQEIIRNFMSCAVICNSKTVATKVVQMEPNVGTKIHVIHNSINDFAVQPVRNGKPSVIAVSNVKKGKGLENVVQVFQALRERAIGDTVDFAIYGRLDDPEVFLPFSDSFISEVYLGTADQQEIYGSALCILHLSESEGFPNAVLEATSVGVIPILSDIPVHRELFDGCAFFVSTLEEAIDVTSNIISIYLNQPDKLRELSSRCFLLASHYSLSTRVGRYTGIIDAHLD